ncbi:MAG: sensor histidine kinase [Metallibacterium sp.]
MRLPELLRTAAFRLALWQGLLFLLVAAVLAGIVGWQVHMFGRDQLRAAIRADTQRLLEERDEPDRGGLRDEIAERLRAGGTEHTLIALLDAHGKRLTGNLPASIDLFGLAPGWHTVDMPRGYYADDGDDASAALWLQRLPDGSMLVVGRDRTGLNQLDETLAGAFAIASGAALLLALIGGLLLGRSYLRRVRVVGASAQRIMDGDLAARIPARAQGGDEFDLLARIQSLMESMRQVSNDIAHDLRTPLTHLRQRMETAARATDAQALRAALAQGQHDIDQVLSTFSAMLSIARIEARERRAGFGVVDLSVLLSDLAADYAPVAEERGQRLATRIAADIAVLGDRRLLQQLFANLIENAMTHSPAHTEIVLNLTSGGERDFLAVVADRGPGIPAAERTAVFKRFYRLDRSRATPGSGLGLALVQAIAELHGFCCAIEDNAPGARVLLRGARAAQQHATETP